MRATKVIIIGSGLGGLSAGVMLAQKGYRVTVLEQEMQAGGCLQCFSRGGVRFETGMHVVGSLDPGQTLYRLFEQLEVLPELSFTRLDPEAYHIISLGGEHFRFANGREAFVETLLRQFPSEADSLARYFDAVKEVAEASNFEHILSPRESDRLMDYQLTSLSEVLRQRVTNPHLRDVLCGDLPLYAAVREKTPFALHAQLMDFYNQSAFRFRGGSDQLAKALIRVLERYGGHVETRSRVTRVVCDDQQVKGVEVNQERYLEADWVISGIHPQALMPMVESPLLRPVYRRRVADIPNTTGVFSLFLKFREGAMPYLPSNVFGYRENTPWGCEDYTSDTWPKGYLYMHFAPEEEDGFARSGVALSYVRWEEMAPWLDTRYMHRGMDYELWKQQHAERLLDLMEADFPDIRSRVENYYTASPLTYRDYCGTPEGAMYGISRDVTLGPAGRIATRTRIPNLLLAGQNINSHGILGVLVGTMTAVSLVTEKK